MPTIQTYYLLPAAAASQQCVQAVVGHAPRCLCPGHGGSQVLGHHVPHQLDRVHLHTT